MIRFFRHLRKNILEPTKARTYLLYAIGEIALVMIGILLALQVNNWNEERVLNDQLETYLSKKLDHLQEDQEKLQLLYDYRVKASAQSSRMLDMGFKKVPTLEFAQFVSMITVEKRFISSLEREQSSEIYHYYKNIKGSSIRDLEVKYHNITDKLTFDEFRLNSFSEDLEADLWRKGFFNDNRVFFNDNLKDLAEVPKLILKEDNGLRSLEAIVRRNEIGSKRLINIYAELMELNRKLAMTIRDYLHHS